MLSDKDKAMHSAIMAAVSDMHVETVLKMQSVINSKDHRIAELEAEVARLQGDDDGS